MKILNILNESVGELYRDITDLQTAVLRRVADGRTTYETASQREQVVMDELAALGLLTDLGYELTPKGASVANVAAKLGSREGREVARRSAALGVKPFNKDRRYSTVGDSGDNLEPDMGAAPLDGGSLQRGEIHR